MRGEERQARDRAVHGRGEGRGKQRAEDKTGQGRVLELGEGKGSEMAGRVKVEDRG